MTADPERTDLLARSSVRWLIGGLVATAFGLLVATQHYSVLSRAGQAVSWWRLAAGELPVWYSWLALFPAVSALARRFPPVGPRMLAGLTVHAVAAAVGTFIMIVVTTAVRYWIGGLLPPRMGYSEAVLRGFTNNVLAFLPVYGILVLGVLAWDYNRTMQERVVRESRLQAALSDARLESLRGQLHPHFLFNTLNAISALMADDVRGARKMIRRLSELLRISLAEGQHEVTLVEELGILDHYVGIQRIRFGDRLVIRYEVDEAAEPMLVPRLLLQPLVENAIKHGPEEDGVSTEVVVAAEVEDEQLCLVVRDGGPGFPDPAGPRRYGIGLTNTQSRLEQLYGTRYRMDLENDPGGGAIVRITVPARPAPGRGGRAGAGAAGGVAESGRESGREIGGEGAT